MLTLIGAGPLLCPNGDPDVRSTGELRAGEEGPGEEVLMEEEEEDLLGALGDFDLLSLDLVLGKD